jgi:hypothetical protein
MSTDYRGERTLSSYPDGVIVASLGAAQNSVTIQGITYNLTQFVSTQLIKINDLTYQVSADPDRETGLVFKNGDVVKKSVAGAAGQPDQVTLADNKTYNISTDPDSKKLVLIEAFTQAVSMEGRVITIGSEAYSIRQSPRDGRTVYIFDNGKLGAQQKIIESLDDLITLEVSGVLQPQTYRILYDQAQDLLTVLIRPTPLKAICMISAPRALRRLFSWMASGTT